MGEFFQLLVSGLATGSIYALAAVGFTLLWQASQTINFAQGEFVMLPAFFVLIGTQFMGLSIIMALLFALIATLFLLGLVFKRIIIDPMLPHGVLPIVISTIALGILLRDSVKEFYSAEAQPFPALFSEETVSVFGAVISAQDIAILVTSLTTITILQMFLTRTRTGRCMQATAQNRGVAEILGVNVNRMILYTFLINAGLAFMASVLISPIYLAKFSNGQSIGLIAFIAAIVGGFNQVRGALAGGLLIGVIDNMSAAYISAEYRTAFPLILLIVIILIRPQGLFGTAEERTV